MTASTSVIPVAGVAAAADPAAGVAAVSSLFGGLFETIDGWRQVLSDDRTLADAPTPGRLDVLIRSVVEQELSRPEPVVVGAGFVARPGWLTDAPWYLSWWLGATNTIGLYGTGRRPAPIRRLAAELDPGAESFRDYTTLEWWRIPVGSGRPHITGPYVDYICTDDYTLTLTAPVQHDGRLVGLVGVDVFVKTVESIVLPQLRRVGRSATVINSAGRVVVSTDPHRAAGMVLRPDGLKQALANSDRAGGLPGGQTLHPCPGTGFFVLLDEQ